MEDQVPFKVYTFWEDSEKPEVRRFGVEKGAVTSFDYLNAKLQNVFPLLKAKTYTVAWRDDEGDDVVISSDEEMVTALTSLGGGLIRLFVTCKKTSFKEDACEFIFTAKTGGLPMDSTPSTPAAGESKPKPKKKRAEEPLHAGVMCDVCDWPVVGFRYKCVVCPDYDLCSNCEASGHHREHCMMRLPSPDISRNIIKAALKRSRTFFKTFATNLDDCPYKKHKAEKNAEKKQHAEEAQARRSEYRRSERRPRHSWMETFASYMNEFANLAGDLDFDFETKFSSSADKKEKNDTQEKEQTTSEQPKNEEPKPESSKQEAPKQESPKQEAPKQEAPKQETSKQEQPKEQAKPEQPKQEQPEQQQSGAPNAQTPPQQPQAGGAQKPKPKSKMPELQKLLEMYVNDYYSGYLPSQKFYATAKARASFSGDGNSTQEFTIEPMDAETAESFGLGPNYKTDSASDRDMSPDKGDDWTMINNEKDMLGAFGPVTGPTETAIPLGFNLPEEFQERVKINDGTNLYPPLNTATAEPEIPKVPQQSVPQSQAKPAQAQAKPQATATQPQATAAKPQATFQSPGSAFQPKASAPKPAEAKIPAQPKTQPQYYHSKPHIDAAIRCMLGMGFTNEGGWLTQLLESKDGNIAAVIDMLNPQAPKK